MNKLKLYSNERVDLDDVDHISKSLVSELQRLLTDLVAGSQTRVLRGFGLAQLTATTASIDLGAAIAKSTDGITVATGQLLSEGEATKTLDFSALAADTYGVWVRFQFKSGEAANRIFWDPVVGEETASSVETRELAEWSATVAKTSPGPEWWQAWEVVWDASDLATSTINDKRVFLFEGEAAAGFGSDWGGGNDRNADRVTYGVPTLERFMAATRQKLEELTGAGKDWWEASTQGVDDAVAKAGDTMSGDLLPSTDGTKNLGSGAFQWLGYFKNTFIKTIQLGQGLAALTARMTATVPAPGLGEEYVLLMEWLHSGGKNYRLYLRTSDGALVITMNAEWANDAGTYKWKSNEITTWSSKLELGVTTFYLLSKDPTAAFWIDSDWTNSTFTASFTAPLLGIGVPTTVQELEVTTDLDVLGTMNAGKGITGLASSLRGTAAAAAANPGLAHIAATIGSAFTLISEVKAGSYYSRIYADSQGRILETINAKWNGATWERDVAGDSFKKQFLDDSLSMIYYPAASSSPWATASWSLIESWEIKAGSLDIRTATSDRFAYAAGSIRLETAAALMLIGNSNAAKTLPVDNTLHANSLVKGWAYLTTDNSVNPVPIIQDGQNLEGFALGSSSLRIGFRAPMANANYAVVATIEGITGGSSATRSSCIVFSRTANDFRIQDAGSVDISECSISIVVFGSQPQP